MTPALRSGRRRPVALAFMAALFCAVVLVPSLRAAAAAETIGHALTVLVDAGPALSVDDQDGSQQGERAPRRCLNGPCALPDLSAAVAPEPSHTRGEPMPSAGVAIPSSVHGIVPTPPPRRGTRA